MSSNLFGRRVLAAAILAVVLAASAAAVAPAATALAQEVNTGGAAAQPTEAVVLQASSSAAAESEVDSLLYMREEEKLAHDVYVALYDKWGMAVFDNIANAESQHMSMVLRLLEARGLSDPAAGNGPGEFTNPELQALYDALVAQGAESAVAALTVGATIEDRDIADLQAALETATDADVRWVFNNLMSGSENHLRAFTRNLDRYGETYEPQYISAENYATITETQDGAGGARGWGGQGGFGATGRGRWMR